MSFLLALASSFCGLLMRLALPVSLALKWFMRECRCCILPLVEILKRLSADFEVLSFSLAMFLFGFDKRT